MKKNLIRLIVLCLVLSALPYNAIAQTNSSNQLIETKEIENVLQEKIPEQLEIKESIIENPTTNETVVEVEANLVSEGVVVNTNTNYNVDENKITVTSNVIDENGNETSQEFQIAVNNIHTEDMIITFINSESGEVYEYNPTVAEASALPLVIIATVARYGIQYAIKKYGKTVVQNTIKSKSYDTVLSSVKSLSANKISHIMAPKHAWHLVTKNNNWDDISKVISHVMRNGTESTYGSALQKTLNMNGHTVTVTFVRNNGKTFISNAWVNTR